MRIILKNHNTGVEFSYEDFDLIIDWEDDRGIDHHNLADILDTYIDYHSLEAQE